MKVAATFPRLNRFPAMQTAELLQRGLNREWLSADEGVWLLEHAATARVRLQNQRGEEKETTLHSFLLDVGAEAKALEEEILALPQKMTPFQRFTFDTRVTKLEENYLAATFRRVAAERADDEHDTEQKDLQAFACSCRGLNPYILDVSIFCKTL